MTEEQAVKHLRALLTGVQRLRSVIAENKIIDDVDLEGLSLTTEMASNVWPWVWGDKCIIRALTTILDNVDNGFPLSPMDFYNMIVVSTQLEPILASVAMVSAHDHDYPQEPDIRWMVGFAK